MVSGVILVDKPLGVSSQYVVTGIKRAFGAKKAGHTGTLDVMASGMLPVCLEEATKFSRFMLNKSKRYTTTVKLGEKRTTGDQEGEVVEERSVDHVDRDLIEHALSSFLGEVEQVPPMYSALKYQGRPLYQLAREGREIERASRSIRIYQLELLALDLPYMTCSVHCSKGTYVRTLFEDIAQKMGTVGYLSQLRRDWVEGFSNQCMVDFQSIKGDPEGFRHLILPMESMLEDFGKFALSFDQYIRLRNGLAVDIGCLDEALVKLYAPGEKFIGLGHMSKGVLKVERLLAQDCHAKSVD